MIYVVHCGGDERAAMTEAEAIAERDRCNALPDGFAGEWEYFEVPVVNDADAKLRAEVEQLRARVKELEAR